MILRRSCLMVPGNNLEKMQEAVTTSADCIVFDLEDSVPVSQKNIARAQVKELIKRIGFSGKHVAVRINAISTDFAPDDILQIAEAAPDEVVIPKVNSPDDIKIVERMLDAAESNSHSDRKIALQAIIETVRGVQAVDEIANASKRLTVLQFGRGDYLADIGAKKFSSSGDDWSVCLYPRSRIVVAATSAGIEAIDTVFPDFKDIEGLKADARRAARMGFRGKWVIHPSQIGIVNEIFTPTPDEIQVAKKLVEAYEKSQMVGVGAITVDDMLIDKAAVVSANKLRHMAEQLGLWDKV